MNNLAAVIPVIDFGTFLETGEDAAESARVVSAFEEFGAVVVHDPRVSAAANDLFLDMMEQYFEQPETKKLADARPQLQYQVGYTPPFRERPRDHRERIEIMATKERPSIPTEADAKGRYYWRVGTPPATTQFPSLNADNVVPEGFPEWSATMDGWGHHMLNAAIAISELLASGLGEEKDALTRRMIGAPHLLDPTGVDLGAFGKNGTICAGFHYDLNFLSLHGKPRFPGLDIWTRGNKRIAAELPDGCLLIQAGRQLEYLTGGRLLNGYHQVVVNEKTLAAIEDAKAAGHSLWRISSTFFAHIASDELLEPVVGLTDAVRSDLYPSRLAGELVQEELKAIGLST